MVNDQVAGQVMEGGLKIPNFGPNDVYHMHSIVVREVLGTSFLRLHGFLPLRFNGQIWTHQGSASSSWGMDAGHTKEQSLLAGTFITLPEWSHIASKPRYEY